MSDQYFLFVFKITSYIRFSLPFFLVILGEFSNLKTLTGAFRMHFPMIGKKNNAVYLHLLMDLRLFNL